ncbi:hypothetical protein [Paenimyroides baculatum]|uniref:Uncharacterized protein n=1 Tax=Paenimyroides baculatum TaxID=2608000 RepID=A0A5M6C9U0_9FLAO|nr:hypothetical protein [Paenimyroides baculatum]KAA5531878.1 hypothetical protein F0460_14780 [Paenimyroides baculatum]
MPKFLKYILLVCGIVLFWISGDLIRGKGFDDALNDLIYSIGFMTTIAVLGYLFYIFVIKKDS